MYKPRSLADTTLYVNLKAIKENYRQLCGRIASGECAAVVKADAYGLGLNEISLALKETGCKHFFVATLDEAIHLRFALPTAKIYVFNGIGRGQESYFLEHGLVPVLISPEHVVRWEVAAAENDKRLPAILHIDTGMNRLGMDLFEAENVLKSAASEVLDFEYIMSHLACADTPEHPQNKSQLKQINAARRLFPGSGVTFANSSGLFMDASYHFDLGRPGCGIYGINPTPGKMNPMKNVVSLISKVLQIRTIDTNTAVGYGATCDLAKGSVVATVPVGYADGYLRSLGNYGKVLVAGHVAPVVGRVSMDLITVDISNVPESDLGEDIPVELIGENLPVDAVAKAADTNGYEVLTRLGSRFTREYTGGAE